MTDKHFRILFGIILVFSVITFTAKAEIMPSDDEYYTTLHNPMKMDCEYKDFESFQSESVSISQTTDNTFLGASVVSFERGTQQVSKTFIIRPGQFAECIYPSGNRIRVKVGIDRARGYGYCGGDPEEFMSVWVNERKIASRVWFTGHCRGESSEPYISFRISVNDTMSIEKCHLTKKLDSKEEPASSSSNQIQTEELSVCVDYPEISNFPRDYVEYPLTQEAKTPKIGEIVLVRGSDAVCQAALDDQEKYFSDFGSFPDTANRKIVRLGWSQSEIELPGDLKGSSENIFDFNNDGKLDRVFKKQFETSYNDGTVLLVQPGSSEDELIVPDSPMADTSMLLPCQINFVKHGILECHPFSQKSDDAGFTVKGKTEKDSVRFRARYSTLAVSNFQGVNYLGIRSNSSDTENYVVILKPLPNGGFQEMCLLQKVTENF